MIEGKPKVKKNTSRKLVIFFVYAILFVAISGCSSTKATECVTQITENCEAGFAKVNDITMYFEVHGKGEPVIVLHGSGDSIETMKNAIVALAKHYRVIAVDTRGHGRTTDSDQPFSNELFAKDIIELMTLLEIDKAHILGLSDGGVTGLAIAMDYPDRIDKLVTIGANFTPDGLTELAVDNMSDGGDVDAVPISPVYEKYAPDPSHWPMLIEKLWQMNLSGPNYTQEDLGKIQAPVLVIMGERDEFIRVEHTEELHRMIPDSILFIVPRAGHNVFDVGPYVPQEVNEAILEFLMTE